MKFEKEKESMKRKYIIEDDNLKNKNNSFNGNIIKLDHFYIKIRLRFVHIFYLYMYIFLIMIKSTLQNNFTDKDCVLENNKYFDFHKPYSKLIDNPIQCIEKSSSCCYIEISYDYAGHPIDNTFCVLLGGDINSRIQQITGILTDQIRYYAEFIYNNYQTLTSIGNNLNYEYYENYTCYDRSNEMDYYTYSEDNCAITNPDNTCKVLNDFKYIENYAKLLYINITKDYCNNRDEFGNCILYDQNPNFNNTGLTPLLDYLISALDIDEISNDEDKKINIDPDPIEKNKNNSILSTKFYKKCKPIVPAKVKIICPGTYISGYFNVLKLRNFLYVFFTFLLFY